ncbi:hypothetical protein PENTCL1PPCAC_7587 [Pristionchus entomophagus]|uniref:Cation-transporting P-type ATPase N-terminal domain-containing protein n=1 Tax=Pristionchus entomophagus TaxID=358040 RepID=A0AAV5SSI6_9BILA|nr:hypothetical protein PENTCL1PPCAC_7587 [Pristionchus entomophagus]
MSDFDDCESVARVEVETIRLRKPAFGLSQDELDKKLKSNKPIRVFCFILYWVVLAALITGAIVIILFGIGVLG